MPLASSLRICYWLQYQPWLDSALGEEEVEKKKPNKTLIHLAKVQWESWDSEQWDKNKAADQGIISYTRQTSQVEFIQEGDKEQKCETAPNYNQTITS